MTKSHAARAERLLVTTDYTYTVCIWKILEFLHAFLKHGKICK